MFPISSSYSGDTTATASNILAHETLFRLSILGDLVGQVIFVCLAIALYRLLSNVNRTWALLMVGFVLVSAAVGFLNTLNNIARLILFRGGEFLSVFDTAQRNALGMLFFRLHSQGIFIPEIFGAYGSSFWVVSLSLRVFTPLHRCLVDNQLFRLCGSKCNRLVLSVLLQRRFWLPPTSLVWRTGNHALAADQRRKGAAAPARHSPNEDGMNMIDNSQRTAAKVAGWSGLLTFTIVVFGNYVLLNPLVVPGDAVATAQNFVAHQTQVRITVVCFLTYSLGVLVLLTALYVILKPINPGLALVGALFRLVFALLWLFAPLNLLGALRLLSNANYLQCLSRIDCRPWRDYISARISMPTMWACLSSDWRRQFAPGCGSSRTTFRGDCRSSA